MPEYPDITIYIERLNAMLSGRPIEKVRIKSPFVLRTAVPPVQSVEGLLCAGFERLGKRIVFVFEQDLFLVIHLMVAGRFQWKEAGCALPGKPGLAAFDFSNGSLLLTEAGTKKRASVHLVRGRDSLSEFDRGGLEVFEVSLSEFRERLLCENHTLKRSLTDPRLFSGIGNAYSDEILHHAGLSPIQMTSKLTDDQTEQLFQSVRTVLIEWTDRFRKETGDEFPAKVTAFRKEMAVHGRFGEPCPVCGAPVQRIRYASNETNYCPECQTGGKILADRSLSRLLKQDWPRSLEALEEMSLNRPKYK